MDRSTHPCSMCCVCESGAIHLPFSPVCVIIYTHLCPCVPWSLSQHSAEFITSRQHTHITVILIWLPHTCVGYSLASKGIVTLFMWTHNAVCSVWLLKVCIHTKSSFIHYGISCVWFPSGHLCVCVLLIRKQL